jgi:hypothetical protein
VQIVEICKRVDATPSYVPVADICNRLFFVPPPRGVSLAAHDRRKILELIDTINSRLINVSEDQLKDIRQIILVAGTARKALAIRYLLSRPKKDRLSIRILCTDQASAKLILDSS